MQADHKKIERLLKTARGQIDGHSPYGGRGSLLHGYFRAGNGNRCYLAESQ